MTIERCTSLRALLTSIAALSACFASSSARADSQHPIVFTDRGPVRGVATADGRQFLGIPYAAPPTGELRWRPPETTASWTQPLDAREGRNNCPQTDTPFGRPSSDENCLFVKVYTPAQGTAHGARCRAPVMVYIHGGYFRYDGGANYDPTLFVRRGVVVVTLNYRLGSLGFLAMVRYWTQFARFGNPNVQAHRCGFATRRQYLIIFKRWFHPGRTLRARPLSPPVTIVASGVRSRSSPETQLVSPHAPARAMCTSVSSVSSPTRAGPVGFCDAG